MSQNMNRVDLIGRLGRDPEYFDFSNGGQKVTLSIPTSERYQDKSSKEWKEITQWHTVVSTSPYVTKSAKGMHKGDLVRVVGQLVYRTYEKDDGSKAKVTEIKIPPYEGSIHRLSNPRGDNPDNVSQVNSAANTDANQSLDELADDIPF